MAPFGSFDIKERIEHFVYGEVELGPLEAGTFEPTSLEEFVALQHLCSVSVQPTGAEQSHVIAEQLAGPDVVEPAPAAPAEAPLAEAPLPEAPAAIAPDADPAAGDDVGKAS